MAPVPSKNMPPPPQSPEAAAALAEWKLSPALESLYEVLQSSLQTGGAFVSCVGERLDHVLRSSYTFLESCSCGFSISKYLHGPGFRPLTGALPILFVLYIIAMLYSAFVFVYLPAAGLSLSSQTSLVFHSIVFLLLSSFVKVAATDPGTVPDTAAWRTFGSPPPGVTERKTSNGEARWCGKAGAYKPDRAHNCRVEGRCVLRMDHHCPWVGNTVGFFNHKYFILLLLYVNAACGMLGFSILQQVLTHAMNPLMKFLLLGSGLLTSELMLILLPFFAFQLYLLASNKTTIEFREGCAEGKSASNYNVGVYGNIAQVMGDNPLLWPFPASGPSGDGLSFPTTAPPISREERPKICIQRFGASTSAEKPSAAESGGDGFLRGGGGRQAKDGGEAVKRGGGGSSTDSTADTESCAGGDGERAVAAKKGEEAASEAPAPVWSSYAEGLSTGCQSLWESASSTFGQVKSICYGDGKKKRGSLKRPSNAGARLSMQSECSAKATDVAAPLATSVDGKQRPPRVGMKRLTKNETARVLSPRQKIDKLDDKVVGPAKVNNQAAGRPSSLSGSSPSKNL